MEPKVTYHQQTYDEATDEIQDTIQGISELRPGKMYSGYALRESIKHPSQIIRTLGIEANDDVIEKSGITSRDLCEYIDKRQAIEVIYRSKVVSTGFGKLDPLLELNYEDIYPILAFFISIVFWIIIIIMEIRKWNGILELILLMLGAPFAAGFLAIVILGIPLAIVVIVAVLSIIYNLYQYIKYKSEISILESNKKGKSCRLYLEVINGRSIRELLMHKGIDLWD